MYAVIRIVRVLWVWMYNNMRRLISIRYSSQKKRQKTMGMKDIKEKEVAKGDKIAGLRLEASACRSEVKRRPA